MLSLYIPTKGRWDTASTPGLLGEYPYTLVVEQQEEAQYRDTFPRATILVLPESHQGIAYARNFINNQEQGWYWMLDDDLTALYRRGKGGTYRKASEIIFSEMQQYNSLSDQLVQLGLPLPRWNYIKNTWNMTCGCIVCNHAERIRRIGASYRHGVPTDTDMTLQILTKGYRTLLLADYAFTMSANGSNAGGLHEVYASGEKNQWLINLQNTWGNDLVTLKRGNKGKLTASIHLENFQIPE